MDQRNDRGDSMDHDATEEMKAKEEEKRGGKKNRERKQKEEQKRKEKNAEICRRTKDRAIAYYVEEAE
jgi:hypothetical protein